MAAAATVAAISPAVAIFAQLVPMYGGVIKLLKKSCALSVGSSGVKGSLQLLML